ncbi:MAG TPA: PEP-CTERM sorting domain-containing protein, partial [Sphingopyxis sp.]|nr:PEP-CTERM sorting domain-containing protein [Sphingopyxis sp.]
VAGVVPVGQAWSRAMAAGVADPNPYDGIAYGQLDLWAYDHYHASVAGSYLSALVTFGAITGVDPTTLGAKEKGADELGLSDAQAAALQRVARDELESGQKGSR